MSETAGHCHVRKQTSVDNEFAMIDGPPPLHRITLLSAPEITSREISHGQPKRKSALVLDIIRGKTTISEASRSFDLAASEVESWVEDGKRGMENALRANSNRS